MITKGSPAFRKTAHREYLRGDYNWTAEETAAMERGEAVPVVVNGTVFQARMPRNDELR